MRLKAILKFVFIDGLALFFISSIVICIIYINYIIFNLFIRSDMDLMIGNETGEKIVIQSCLLNGLPITKCSQELQNKQNAFFNPKRFSYPKNNIFSVRVIVNNEDKQYFCTFEKYHHRCMEEMSLTKKELRCGARCVSIF